MGAHVAFMIDKRKEGGRTWLQRPVDYEKPVRREGLAESVRALKCRFVSASTLAIITLPTMAVAVVTMIKSITPVVSGRINLGCLCLVGVAGRRSDDTQNWSFYGCCCCRRVVVVCPF
jgi:hypothetical protein